MDKQRSFFMKKINSSMDKKLVLGFFVKSIILSVILTVVFSALISLIIYKLDLDTAYLSYLSIAVVLFSAAAVSYICSKPFKNNGFMVGVISVMPLIIYSCVNIAVNKTSIIVFAIKIVLTIIISGVFGAISVKNNKRIRIKK